MSLRGDALIFVGFVLLASVSFLALPGAALHAQAGKVHRIGFLREGQPPQSYIDAFQHGLRERGYVDGQNVVVEYRTGSLGQLPQLAEELVRLKVDIIVASAGSAALAAKRATTWVPIVFATVNYPVEIGLVSSLSRPGGNITGTSFNAAELAGKRLELLRELVPTARRVAVLSHPPYHTNATQIKEAEVAARTLGMQLEPVLIRDPNDFEAAFNAVHGADGLLQPDMPFFNTHRARVVALAARSRTPAIYGFRSMVEAGGLMSYGPDVPDLHRRAATYVDKILKGARPGDLPVDQPAKFEFVINTRTAKALGLTMPPSLLLRADQVIE
jgi:putative ABC transport system substrate-binding protein